MLISLFLFFSVVSADDGAYEVDLDADGQKETATVYQRFEGLQTRNPWAQEGVVTLFRSDGHLIGSFTMPDHMGKLEFISFNRDGVKQIIAWSYGVKPYTNIAVYGYEEGQLTEIFRKNSGYEITADFKVNPAQIKVGRQNLKSENLPFEPTEPLWKIYVWNGETFIYDDDLTTEQK